MNLRLTSVFLAVGIALSACSTTSGGSGSTVVTATMPPATSTTIPSIPIAAVEAWNEYITSFEVVDVSDVSNGECGARAMLITEESLTFYWWDGVRWNDDSSKLLGGKGALPLKVHTHDFTNDGVLDFFIIYEEKKDGPTYGAYFAYPWSGSVCEWRWMDIDNGTRLTQRIDRPEVNQRNGEVFAEGYSSRNWKSYGVYEYQPSSNSFVFREVRKKK
jgi:ABC-type glycerol-3-phosphate transport system substrate-binding protein